MEKLIIFDVDAYMPDFMARLEEHQVTGAQVAALDGFPDLGLMPGRAGKLNTEVVAVSGIDKSRAVDAPFAQASQRVSSAFPLPVLRVDYLLYRLVACPGRSLCSW